MRTCNGTWARKQRNVINFSPLAPSIERVRDFSNKTQQETFKANMAEQERPREMTQGFPVPKAIIGFIIGKKGANIGNIEKASGAKLSVSDRTGPQSFKRDWIHIQLSGTGNQIDRAKKLLIINVMEATSREGGQARE